MHIERRLVLTPWPPFNVIINGGPTARELSSVLAHMRVMETGGGTLFAMPRSQRRRTSRCKDTVYDLCSDDQTSLIFPCGCGAER